MSDTFDNEAVPDYVARGNLAGQIHAVLGGGRGIGRQTAHALSQAGATVLCVDFEHRRATLVADEIGGHAYQLDVTDANQVTGVFQQMVESHGRLDGVVDIVGASIGRSIQDIDSALIAHNFSLNLFQAIEVTRAAALVMAKTGGGTVVLVGSAAGIMNLPNQAIYGSAKAALHHFTRYAATEFGHQRIRVNAVAPGYIRTERMVERFDADNWAEIAENTPLQRAGATADIASAALFLSSEMSSFITGQVLVADGGLLNAPRIMRMSSALQIAGKLVNA